MHDEILIDKVTVEEAYTRTIERLVVKKTIYPSFPHSKAVATVHEDDGHLAHVSQRRTDGHLGTPHPSNTL